MIKRIMLALIGLTLTTILAFTAIPAHAAVKHNTWYKNGRGTRTLIVNVKPTTVWAAKIKPRQTRIVYGSVKYGWVPTGCQLLWRTGGSWRPVGSALYRTGYWVKLPQGAYVTLGTWCR